MSGERLTSSCMARGRRPVQAQTISNGPEDCHGHARLDPRARCADISTARRGLSTLVLLGCAGTRAATPTQGWRIDEARTSIGFKIDAVGFPTTRGHFTRYSGRILIDF